MTVLELIILLTCGYRLLLGAGRTCANTDITPVTYVTDDATLLGNPREGRTESTHMLSSPCLSF